MKREETIYKAKHLRKVHPSICIDAEDFWDTVIAALEQEPCDDCISRQAAIDAVEDDNRNGHYSCFASNNDAQCFKQIIRDIPSVTPAKKVGQWIDVDGIWFKCSKCGAHRKMMPAYKEYYCPNCGAKMASPAGAEGSEE